MFSPLDTFADRRRALEPLELIWSDDPRVLAVGQNASRFLPETESEFFSGSVVAAADSPGADDISNISAHPHLAYITHDICGTMHPLAAPCRVFGPRAELGDPDSPRRKPLPIGMRRPPCSSRPRF
jgi:hypothetical protein